MAGILYLMPVPLGAEAPREALPEPALQLARLATYVLAENARSARAFLKAAGHPGPLQQVRIIEIGHAPAAAQADQWLEPLLREGLDALLVSECGCPAIADPGATVVARAHELGLTVRPLVGPSSLWLALMASGMNGQRFRFHGYLPQDGAALAQALRGLERDAGSGETQLFIETPYRSERMFEAILAACAGATRLCVALDLGGDEAIRSMSISQWKALAPGARPVLRRRPAVFLLHAGPAPAPSGSPASSRR
jgi:16S rRNA (cytidine1402-2'-O)-methyltransferase